MRINAFLARHTRLSRRKADRAIKAGRVIVNGSPAEIGQTVSAGDSVKFDDSVITMKSLQYVAFNKPKGYITSRKQTSSSPIIYDLLPNSLERLKPAGRLDKDSEGLLLLTNDGKAIQRLTHPSNEKKKKYFVTLDIPLSNADEEQINAGVDLPDGKSSFIIERQKSGYIVTITEGRNRQIRRTFGALDYRVETLKRVEFGPYILAELELDTGEWKEVPPPSALK